MKKYIIEIGKHGFIYTVANLITKAAGVILIPIYTIYLDTAEYGIVANVLAIINLFTIFYTFGMEAAWSRFFFDYKDRSADQKILLANVLGFLFIFGFSVSLSLTIFGEGIFRSIIPELDFSPYIILGIWTAFFGIFFNIKLSIYRVRQQSLYFGLFTFGRFILMITLTI